MCIFYVILSIFILSESGRCETFREPVTGIEFVRIKGGCFIMGDVFDKGREDEKPNKEICLDDYYIGKYEVTQEQWISIIGKNPSFFQKEELRYLCGVRLCVGCREDACETMETLKFPVENVSWDDVQEFLEKLNKKTGRQFRLPTEAEWEYAARSGGKKEKWAGTHFEHELDRYAWYRETSNFRTNPVGTKEPNGLGLYDMTGNVWEWVNDIYDPDYYKFIEKHNPQGPKIGATKVMRGGSWFEDPQMIRTSARGSGFPFLRSTNIGFRLAHSIPKPPKPAPPPPVMEETILEKGRVTLNIQFDFDKWNVKPMYHNELEEFANVMKKHPEMKVTIEGHTCSIGGAKYNLGLSQKRAESVRRYLIEKFGIEPERLQAKGYGLTKPIASNKTAEGRRKNRRIEAVAEYTIKKVVPKSK
ncbi:MAG: SUMF1/EgtB/PvdO family nonheme iron enzyme [Syntrophorhabdaceae bacterium]|nr:SUMF1/EgtB/PvdO family nonheme iron enzyme [Syntrophorhabdaceae bacterium]